MTLLAYLPALRAGWIWDDDYYVTKNHNLRDTAGLKNIWTKFGLKNGGTPQYYPVTHTTFWVEHQLCGVRPAGYHLVNILLHATNAILLWLILKRFDVPGAWIVACVFALHPVHVESVAWVTERKNTLSGVFYLGAMLAYLKGVGCRGWGVGAEGEGGDSSSLHPKPYTLYPRLYVLALALFVSALLSKSVTASLPAAILLIVWWERGRITLRDVAPLVPMFILGIAMGGLTSWMEREHVGAQGFDWELSIWQRILIAGRAVWFYAYKLVLPIELSFIYPRWDVDPSRAWQWFFPIAAIALVVFTWAMRRRWGRGPLVAILFFGGTLLPALGFVDVYPMRYSFVADHFPYLASVALIALIVAAMRTWLAPRAKLLAAIWLVALGALTFRQTLVYKDRETLWRDTIAKNPTGWMPRNNLANIRIEQEKYDEAEALLAEALKHNPEQPEVLVNLGAVAEKRGRPAQAMSLYRRALAQSESANALANLGSLHLQQGELDQAERAFRRAIEVEPTSARAHRLLGVALASRQDFRAAAEAFARAAQLDPSSPESWNNLGAARENLGDAAGAIEAYERAVAADPTFEPAKRNLDRVRRRTP
jgi:Flp pilus assembly protein TadD